MYFLPQGQQWNRRRYAFRILFLCIYFQGFRLDDCMFHFYSFSLSDMVIRYFMGAWASNNVSAHAQYRRNRDEQLNMHRDAEQNAIFKISFTIEINIRSAFLAILIIWFLHSFSHIEFRTGQWHWNLMQLQLQVKPHFAALSSRASRRNPVHMTSVKNVTKNAKAINIRLKRSNYFTFTTHITITIN